MTYKKLILKSTAAIEIEEVISHYSAIDIKLARKFEIEIRSCFIKILKNPESFQFRYKTIRVIWLRKFPFGIYYIYDADEIYIIAFWSSKEDIPSKFKKL